MSITKRKYQITESIIGSVISMALSALFVFIVFDSKEPIQVFGEMGVIVDAIPQSMGIAFMATLIPTIMTRMRISNGDINAIEGRLYFLPNHAFLRSLLMGLIFTILGVTLHFVVFSVLNIESINFEDVLIFKAIYGAILGALVGFTALSHLHWNSN